jgi:hypothetical protein
MTSPTFILTTSPFGKDDIPLASLVPDRRSPSTDLKTPYDVKPDDYSKNQDKNFDGLISSGSETWFKLLLTRFLSAALNSEKTASFKVTADNGYIYMLKQPKSLFKKVVSGEAIKEWLEQEYRDGQETWFVIGYRTFVNAKLFRERHKSREASGKGAAPIGQPVGDGTGSTDVEVEVGHKSWDEVIGATETTGERIYAICYRRVILKFCKGKLQVRLDGYNTWKPFSATMGENEVEEEYIEADIADEDDNGGCEIIEGSGNNGMVEIFGVLSNEEEGA